jgi:hypothetical protein
MLSPGCAVNARNRFRDALLAPRSILLRTLRPILRSQWNAGFCADSGRSRGDPSKGAIRPFETSLSGTKFVDRGGSGPRRSPSIFLA